MNAASGELSLTAIAVVAIAAIGVLFTTVVWPSIKSNITTRTQCSQAFCTSCDNGMCDCTFYDEDGTQKNIKCPDTSSN